MVGEGGHLGPGEEGGVVGHEDPFGAELATGVDGAGDDVAGFEVSASREEGELARAIADELGDAPGSISQSYLSQIESGARPHLTNTSRLLLAKFFKVHPGYLVDDPEGYQTKLITDLRLKEDRLDQWLI